MVLEVPAAEGGSITGSVMNCWQAPLDDVGTAGADAGHGGRYLIVPPGWDQPVPEGYLVLRSDTVRGYGLLRSIPAGPHDQDVEAAVAYARRVRQYPLDQAADPPDPVFVEVLDEVFDSAIPYDARFFEVLDSVVQVEPWLQRDRVMIDQLASLGIRRGEPFVPDDDRRRVLAAASAEAHALLDHWYEEANRPYTDTAHWGVPVRPEYLEATTDGFSDPQAYAVDGRALTFSFGFFSARHLGRGQFYLMGTRDSAGEPLDGSRSYRLRVPADAPVTQYWAATVYDRDTHTLLREVPRVGRSSLSPGLAVEDDGSVVLHVAPAPPEGHETNWVPTLPGRRFEILFRLYGPTQALFDKTWRLPDLEA